jgi:hypothetical protein
VSCPKSSSDLQAEEGAWNYVPAGGNLCSGRKTAFIPDALVFLEKTPARIGSTNIKVCNHSRIAKYLEDADRNVVGHIYMVIMSVG